MSKIYERYKQPLIILRQLVATDFKLRYQGSALGYLWSVLRPLLMFLVLYIVFVRFLKIRSNVNDPAIYLLTGIVLWTFFFEVTTRAVDSVLARSDILRKISFPKYIVVVSVTISAFINLFLNSVVVMVFMLFGKSQPILESMFFVPLYLMELFVFSLGLGFLLSAIFVKLRDINYIWEVILQVGFYATPILYPISAISEQSLVAAKILLLNPVAHVIQEIRYYLVDQNTLTTSSIFNNGYYKHIPVLIAIAVFIIGALVFRAKSKYFAEDI